MSQEKSNQLEHEEFLEEQARLQRMLYAKGLKEVDSLETVEAAKEIARDRAISFEEALMEVTEREIANLALDEITPGFEPPADAEDAKIDRAARRLAEEENIGYDEALTRVLDSEAREG